MATVQADHDAILTLVNDMKYVREFIEANTSKISCHEAKIDELKSWQDGADTRIKTYMGVATFVGAVIFFVIENVWRFWERTR